MIASGVKPLFTKLKEPVSIAFLLCLILLLLSQIISPGFASWAQIVNILTVASFLGFVAAGQSMVIIGGGIDLSVGKMVTFGAIMGGALMNGQDGRIIIALLLTLAASFVLGLFNGLGITLFRIPPLVMTLGMGIVISAISKFITGGVPVEGAPPLLKGIIIGRALGIPGVLFIWLFLSGLMVFLLRNTRYGLSLYSSGANERAARLSGVSVRVVRTVTYGFCALISGFAGFIYLGYVGSVYNITLGDKYTLPSIIAVVIGGTSLAGGRGGYIGAIAGAILLQLLESILVTVNLPPQGRQVIFGAVLLILMLAYGREKRLRV